MPLAISRELGYTKTMKSLFSRLMLFFLVVMLVPVSLLAFAYITAGNRALENNLAEQGDINIRGAAVRMQQLIEEYRHKAYTISVEELVVDLLEQDSFEGTTSMNQLYERLFTIMKGDTYLATASVVSTSGRVRLSTHLFPYQYDLRYQGNDTNPFFDLSRAGGETASLITFTNRYMTQNNSFVFFNILRRVRDVAGTVLGYVAVDVYHDALSDMPTTSGFTDIILIDSETYVAASLNHLDRHGDFTKLPELKSITFPLFEGSIIGEGNIISVAAIPNTQLYLAGVTDMAILNRSIEGFMMIVGFVLAVGAVLAGILAYFFSRSIAKPVNDLALSMHQVEMGEMQTQVTESRILEIGQAQQSFNAMVRQITNLMELTREEEAKVQEAERRALEAQMNPHFLYNTLNTVKAIARMHDEREILTITTKLGKLLRNAIDNREQETSLKESFSLVESYLTIQKIRYGAKLDTYVELDPSIEKVMTPKLIIQPLVENALIHGLEPKLGRWRLSVTAISQGDKISITVADNGIGFPDAPSIRSDAEPESSTHVGLYNIHRRLQFRYGSSAGITIDSIENEGTIIKIRLPRDERRA